MDLTSNQSGVAPNLNPQLINAWGLVQLGTSPIWLSDNGSGLSTLYNGAGNQLSLIVVVPGVGGAQGTPTGIVGNTGAATDFFFTNSANGESGRAILIFATLDGAIVAWNPVVGGTDPLGRSLATIPENFTAKPGASYTGLAIATNSQGKLSFTRLTIVRTARLTSTIARFNGSNLSAILASQEILCPTGFRRLTVHQARRSG